MANLNDLAIQPISQMARGDLILHILTIRNARRVKVKPQKTTIKKSRKIAEPKSVKDLLSMLSPEQAKMLLSQLEDDDGD